MLYGICNISGDTLVAVYGRMYGMLPSSAMYIFQTMLSLGFIFPIWFSRIGVQCWIEYTLMSFQNQELKCTTYHDVPKTIF